MSSAYQVGESDTDCTAYGSRPEQNDEDNGHDASKHK